MELNKKKKTLTIAIFFIIVALIGFYFRFTHPIQLTDVVTKEKIVKIYISISDTENRKESNQPPQEIMLDDKNEWNRAFDILNSFIYSRKFKYVAPTVIPPTPYSKISVFIYYLDNNTQLTYKYIGVDSQNNVIIRNNKDVNIPYRVKSSEKHLYNTFMEYLKINNNL